MITCALNDIAHKKKKVLSTNIILMIYSISCYCTRSVNAPGFGSFTKACFNSLPNATVLLFTFFLFLSCHSYSQVHYSLFPSDSLVTSIFSGFEILSALLLQCAYISFSFSDSMYQFPFYFPKGIVASPIFCIVLRLAFVGITKFFRFNTLLCL